MGKPISLFSGYSQKENRVTNYCLLLLKMLYEENPKFLADVLAGVVGESLSGDVGISFRQQERKGSSIPDGLIVQQPLTIFLETKNFDWFYDDQLERHLTALNDAPGKKVLIALGNFEALEKKRFEKIESICEHQYKGSIVFRAATFEDLVGALKLDGLSKNISDAVSDFRDYLNEENLLPAWRDWLDVVNCAGIPEDITVGGVYICPAKGGAYTHGRCRFFGMYKEKTVQLIAEIEAVVDVDLNAGSSLVKWKNAPGENTEFESRAVSAAQTRGSTEGPARVFLLGQLFGTDFQKDSLYGMQASKRYFNIAHLKPKNAEQLAQVLKDRKWSEFDSQSTA